ncbi:MAG: hypothetical protein IPM98_19280 [Lewinellaceae bacterium]|nr:hypothetical protein [Lewinellaceae bacterium]
MKFILPLFAFVLSFSTISAQTDAVDNTRYQIVFHLTSGDTLAHKALVKQLNNLLHAAPKSRIEVVTAWVSISL